MPVHWFKAARKRQRVTHPLRTPFLVVTASCAVVGAGALIPAGPLAPAAHAAEECGPSPAATLFTDPVAQPPVAAPDRPGHYTLTAHLGTHQFSSGWPAVPTLGYRTANAKVDYLGPTIVTKKGQPVDVTLANRLPASGTKMFPFDQPNDHNAVVLHRHGGLQAAASDGSPGQEIPPGGSRTNHYPNNQAAAPLWYHDHADLTTSYSVYEGLAGFMPNTDNLEPLFNLPGGNFAKAYVLQDKSFNADHTLCYTHAAPEFFGDLPVVNGTIAPFQQVEPRRYTFTFINGSDSRFYHLSLQQTGGATGASAPPMTVVGSDSGYVLHPAKVSDLLIAPGERYKMVVDFTGHAGQNWVLANDAATPFPDGDDSVATIPRLMSFQVNSPLSSTDRSSVPPVIVETNNLIPPSVSLLTARLRTVQAGESSPGVAQLGDAVQLRDSPTRPPRNRSSARPRRGRCATTARIPIRSTCTWSSYAWSGAGTWVNGTPRRPRARDDRAVPGPGRVGVRTQGHLRGTQGRHHRLGGQVHHRRDIGLALPHPVPRRLRHPGNDAAAGGR